MHSVDSCVNHPKDNGLEVLVRYNKYINFLRETNKKVYVAWQNMAERQRQKNL